MTKPRRNRYRYLVLGSIVLVGGLLSVIAAWMVEKWQIQQQQIQFNERADHLGHHWQQHLNEYLHVTEALGIFYEKSEEMSRQDFQDFSHLWQQAYPGIVEFTWVPRLSSPEIEFEGASAQPLRLLLEQARDSGKIAASDRLSLAPDKTAFALYYPLYRRGSAPNTRLERRQAFVGAILTLYQLSGLAKAVLSDLPQSEWLTFYLIDRAAASDQQLLLVFDSKTQQIITQAPALARLEPKALTLPLACQILYQCERSLSVANREWRLVVIPPPISFEETGLALIVFLAGLGLTGWLSRTVWQMLAEQERIEGLVALRTVELHQARAAQGERIEQLTAELKAVNQAKQDWLSHLAHELRTPLNIMAGFTQLLNSDRTLTPQQRETLVPILRSSEHLLVLLDNLLEMAKLEAGIPGLVPTSFNLPTFVNNLVEILRLRASSKGVQVNAYLAPGVPQYVSADENKLRQVLLNLLDNAIKYTDEGSVTLRVENGDRSWTLNDEAEDSASVLFFEVEDTGVGLTPALIQRVFEPFLRGDSKQPGTGLGLYITRRLVSLMGGSIQVSSQLGVGTLFQLKIPVNLPEPETIAAFPCRQRVIGLASGQPEYRILIVDDQADNRLLLTKILAPLGFHWREAANSEDALEIWTSWRPQLILLDTRMPQMDSYGIVEQIRASAQQQRTIFIALTAGNLEVSRQDSLTMFDGVLRKPFPVERLLETIATYLDLRFRYESTSGISDSEAIAESSSLILQSAALRVMPPAWIAQVHQAACAGHSQAIVQLIQEIPVQNEALALALTTLVHHFQFRQIQNLTDPH